MELYVISDLHVGGAYGPVMSGRGFRINTHVDALIGLLEEVRQRAQRTRGPTELIINGDFVDFLAEEGRAERKWRPFLDSDDEAIAAFDSIRDRDRGLFEALRTLLDSGVDLTLLIGNHDVELSLPAVRSRLDAALASAKGGGRFRFLYDGEAYVVGDVLIEHGNRYDGFNVIDHDRLRRFRSVRSRRLEAEAEARFQPPAGSRLVADVMNPIKELYPFIDLLKPETGAVVPLLIALEPGYARDVDRICRLSNLYSNASAHEPKGAAQPSYAGDIAARGEAESTTRRLETVLAERMDPPALQRLMAVMDRVEQEQRTSAEEISFRDTARSAWSLLRISLSRSWDERKRLLLDALRALRSDTSFDRSSEIDEYRVHAEALAAVGFRVVVFGHTHLAKDVKLEHGAKYLNTGTWADLIRVPTEIVSGSDTEALAALNVFVDAIKAREFGRYVCFSPTFAHIELDDTGKTLSATVKDYTPGMLLDS